MSRARVLAIALAVLGAALIAFGGIAHYAKEEVVDVRAFSKRTATALQRPAVREVVAEQVVSALVQEGSADLLSVRPLLSSAVEALVPSKPFRSLFVLAVREAHARLFGGRRSTVLVDLERAGGLLLEGLRSVSPAIAAKIPKKLQPELATVDDEDAESHGSHTLADLADLGLPAILLGLVLLAGSVVAAGTDRRAALGRAGMAVTGAAALVWVVVEVGDLAVKRHAGEVGTLSGDRVRDALGEVWNSLVGDLQTWALGIGALGIAIAAVGSRAVTPAELVPDALGRLRAALASQRGLTRVARGAAALGFGLLLILRPDFAASLILLAAGGLLVFLGVGELAGALEGRPVRRRREPTPSPRRVAFRLGALILTVAAVATATLLIALPTAGAPKQAVPPESVGCNGSRELCKKRLNEVVFPATHNSFSAAEQPGWLFANQRFGIERQLEDGIRGFLVDVHYGVRQRNGKIRTDLRTEGSSRNRVKKALSPEALQAADRLVGNVGLGRIQGEREPFLCHTLCELGARPFVEELRVIAGFMERQRGALIVLFFEPYVPPAEIERGLRAAGLLDHVAELARDEPLPTLGELVGEDRRLIVFTETDGGARPWYLDAFSFAQDTPLGATKGSQLSCERERGDSDSPLFLLNHWIDSFPPSPSANARIESRAALLDRAKRCARERRLVPNLIAVDHYDRGEIVDVARELNRRPPVG